MTKPLIPSKMRISIDDEETMKIGWQKGSNVAKKTPIPQNQTFQTHQQENICGKSEVNHIPLMISANPKV